MEHAHRLRRAEAEVEGGHRDAVMGPTETARRQGIVASEDRSECVTGHLAAQSQRGGSRAQPPSGGLDTGLGPVARHIEVVGVPAFAHLGHPQHPTSRVPASATSPEVAPEAP